METPKDKILFKDLTCESSAVKMASKANILGAATPTRRSSGAVDAPPQVAGSKRVTCFLRVSTLKKEEEEEATEGMPEAAQAFVATAALATLSITFT
jgi:hypothetical protein